MTQEYSLGVKLRLIVITLYNNLILWKYSWYDSETGEKPKNESWPGFYFQITIYR